MKNDILQLPPGSRIDGRIAFMCEDCGRATSVRVMMFDADETQDLLDQSLFRCDDCRQEAILDDILANDIHA